MGKLARENRLRREAVERLAQVHTLRRDTFSEEAVEIIRVANQELSVRFDALSDARFQLGPPVSFGAQREYSPW